MKYAPQQMCNERLRLDCGDAHEEPPCHVKGVFGGSSEPGTALQPSLDHPTAAVQSLGVIWVKFVDATTPTVSGYGPWWIAGDKTGAKYFDDTAIAKA